jgi:hypothetical protein
MDNISSDLIFCGIGQHESVLHFGACDKDLNFIQALDEYELDIEYTAVDTDDSVKTLFTDAEPLQRTHTWISEQMSMQEFLDGVEDRDYTGVRYNWTLLTGIFDKPLYSERQYQFIDTIIENCVRFSDNVVFTIKEIPTPVFKYSMVYLFSHFTVKYAKVTVKKVSHNNYIFHIY